MALLIFKNRDELIQVKPEDIVYFKADGNYCKMLLTSRKEQLLTINLSKVQSILDEQLGFESHLFERVGRDLIIRKACIFSIQILKKKLVLSVSENNSFIELQASKEALKILKDNTENKPHQNLYQLRDLITRKVYPLSVGNNRFGRKSHTNECEHSVDNGDSLISRIHFNILVYIQLIDSKYEFYAVDLKSSNGTFLNDERVSSDSPQSITVGAKIKAGKTEFVLEYIDLERTEIIR